MINLKELVFTTDIEGKVENTNLPVSNFLLPIFETIVNSIHAIDDSKRSDGNIIIKVYREKLLPDADKRIVPKIIAVDITDNGIGFTDENMISFVKADSRYKKTRGGKGLGRFIWLKAFNNITIESYYIQDGVKKLRQFDFIAKNPGLGNIEEKDINFQDLQTTVHLKDYINIYAEKACKANTIAKEIAAHLFNEFLSEKCPKITLIDEMSPDSIIINDLVKKDFIISSKDEVCNVMDKDFNIKHILLKERNSENHIINYCADNRVVESHRLELPNLEEVLMKEGSPVVYSAYISSDFLNKNVNNERTRFNVSTTFDLNNNEITWNKIEQEIQAKASDYLATYMNDSKEQKNKIIEDYIFNEANEYAPLKDALNIDTIDIKTAKNKSSLDMALYKRRQALEQEARIKGQELLKAVPADNREEYDKNLDQLFSTVDKLNSSALVKYICSRRAILQIFEDLLSKQDNDKYPLEKAIHNLIYSMGKDSYTLEQEHNLWIIDEKLPFSSYISSDKKFSSMHDSVAIDKTMEPDIAVFNNIYAYGESFPNDSTITFIEFKRPDRDDYSLADNPIQQIFEQIDQVMDGKAKSDKGVRYNEQSRFYGYAVCTITPSLKKIIDQRTELHPFPEGQGFFGCFPKKKLYLEIVDYQKVLDNAKKRNRAFFDKIGIK